MGATHGKTNTMYHPTTPKGVEQIGTDIIHLNSLTKCSQIDPGLGGICNSTFLFFWICILLVQNSSTASPSWDRS